MLLKGRKAIIIGASSGIGKATATGTGPGGRERA
jgi:NAD(P)-dependent dehydrogenase (short-subunit alcohol dehydrogenase family)